MGLSESRSRRLQDGEETKSLAPDSVGFEGLEYSLTDCGNAERLVEQHGESVRYCGDTSTWLVWNGCRWTTDTGAVAQLAKKTVRTIQVEHASILRRAARQPGSWREVRPRADAMWRWAQRSESEGRIVAMLRLAQSDPRVVVQRSMLDRDEWLLNLPNGTVDLRSCRLREHRPQDLLTKTAGVNYEPNATCDRWRRFLEEVFRPNPDVIPFLQRAIGYTLTGDTREHSVFVLLGRGRNGKSTLLDVLSQILGEYSGVAEIETFLTTRGTVLREDIADLRGRRLVTSQEPSLRGRLAENTLKWVSGGDRLRARRLYENAQEFSPTHKLWLAVNRLPAVCPDDPALLRRLRVIPFDVSFANSPDRELKRQLREESSGILLWALEGCLLWQQHGIGTSPSVRKTLAASVGCSEERI